MYYEYFCLCFFGVIHVFKNDCHSDESKIALAGAKDVQLDWVF